jgi:hypothetical protein
VFKILFHANFYSIGSTARIYTRTIRGKGKRKMRKRAEKEQKREKRNEKREMRNEK